MAPPSFRRLRHGCEWIGEQILWMIGYVGSFSLLLGRALAVLRRRDTIRWPHVLAQMEQIGWNSVPIVAMIGFFIGMVLAFQSAYQMHRFGADIYIAGLVSLSITREIGPVLTALIVAGRVGAAIAAEIGTMQVTEQVDAMKTLATDPVRYLVVPRLIALTVSLVLLTIFADALGIAGGYTVATVKLGISHQLYLRMTWAALVMKDFLTGLLKAFVFAVIIAIVSCHEGFRTEGGAEGVGRATMLAVVLSFVFIIAADWIFTALFYFV